MNRANLMLHCGASAVSREQVAGVLTPSRTASWVPIPHHRLLAGVQETLARWRHSFRRLAKRKNQHVAIIAVALKDAEREKRVRVALERIKDIPLHKDH